MRRDTSFSQKEKYRGRLSIDCCHGGILASVYFVAQESYPQKGTTICNYLFAQNFSCKAYRGVQKLGEPKPNLIFKFLPKLRLFGVFKFY